MPAAMFSAICCSRWKRSSASNSCSTSGLQVNDRSRSSNLSAQRIASRLVCLHHQVDCRRQPVPVGQFFFHLRASAARQRVELSLTPAIGLGPVSLDPTLLLQPVQRRVEGTLLFLQFFFRDLLNTLGDGPAVLGLERKGLENQKIQSALHQIARFTHISDDLQYTGHCRSSEIWVN